MSRLGSGQTSPLPGCRSINARTHQQPLSRCRPVGAPTLKHGSRPDHNELSGKLKVQT